MLSALLLTLALVGVNSQNTSDANCTCDTPLSVATYNILQIPFAPFRQQRFEGTLSYLQANTFDILCIQELFDPDQKQQLISALSSVYPYNVTPGQPANDTCHPPCDDQDTNLILSCLSGNQCLIEDNFAALICLVDYCKDELDEVSNSCTDCVFSITNGISLSDKMEKCAGQKQISVNIDGNQQDAYDACNYLFDNESDTLILSKYPITNSDILKYKVSPFFFNTALYGQIEVPNFGTVHTFCTHTAADIPFSNNENANRVQTRELIAWVNSKVTSNNATVIVAGDFNMSPEGAFVEASFAGSYWDMSQNFVDSAYLYTNTTNTDYLCTYCSDNDLTSYDVNSVNIHIDHIFVRDSVNLCVNSWDRFAMETPIRVEEFLNNGRQSISLSDHYGVNSKFCASARTIGDLAQDQAGQNNSSNSLAIHLGALVAIFLWFFL